jgi:glyoxalase family protein
MKLDGIHHITCITGDAPRNVEFYTGTMGLRLVKKSVNQDDPTIYHLFYADELGSPGADITFFEYPGAPRGRAGAGMVHRIVWRVDSTDALAFWERRLQDAGIEALRTDGKLSFTDPEGLGLELRVVRTDDEALRAKHPDIPEEFAITGFEGTRAYSSDVDASRELFEEVLSFGSTGDASWDIRGATRGSFYAFDPAPPQQGLSGAGTVHHVAWATPMDEHQAWRDRIAEHGYQVTPVIDRFWFRSIYFREPSGVLFEIATQGPGFSVDEPIETLGEHLTLPPNYEHLRDKLEEVLTPLPPTRA